MTQGRRGRDALWLVGALALLAGAGPRAEGQPPDDGALAAGLRSRLETLLNETKTASWVQVRWERKGDEEQVVRSRCLWTADGLLRMDVEEGKGAGASLLRRGDEVTIKPPGLLGIFKLRKSVTDGQLLSLRGKDLRTAGFLPELQRVLEHWEEVQLHFSGERAVLRYPDAERLQAQMAIRLEGLTPISIEAREGGRVVERTTFDQVRYGVPVDRDKLAP